jgi:fructose-bisphosphate aldolase class II
MKENRFMKVINDADQKGIAVGAVNIFNYLTADAAITAAKELGVNLIIQTSAGTVEHFGADKLFAMVDAARKDAGITVALHLDHCRKTELGKACVDAGWDAVMMDFSHLPLEENIARTKEVADYAHAKGVAIEGEIGVISGVEEDIVAADEVKAGYDETVEFIKGSDIDVVAPAIGTAHGVYKGVPKLDFELVERLGKDDTPIVIHGGSGLSAETFSRLIALGGRKVNISTVVKNAYLDTTKALVESGEKLAPIPFDTRVFEAVKDVVKKHLAVFSGLKKSFE